MTTFMGLFATVCVVVIGLCLLAVALEGAHQRRLRRHQKREPIWFSDQHVEERRALIRSFEAKAAKGLSEESKSRAHLQAVTKAGDSRS